MKRVKRLVCVMAVVALVAGVAMSNVAFVSAGGGGGGKFCTVDFCPGADFCMDPISVTAPLRGVTKIAEIQGGYVYNCDK